MKGHNCGNYRRYAMKRVLKEKTKLQEETADAVKLVLETPLGKVRFDKKAYPVREKPDILKHENDNQNSRISVC